MNASKEQTVFQVVLNTTIDLKFASLLHRNKKLYCNLDVDRLVNIERLFHNSS